MEIKVSQYINSVWTEGALDTHRPAIANKDRKAEIHLQLINKIRYRGPPTQMKTNNFGFFIYSMNKSLKSVNSVKPIIGFKHFVAYYFNVNMRNTLSLITLGAVLDTGARNSYLISITQVP